MAEENIDPLAKMDEIDIEEGNTPGGGSNYEKPTYFNNPNEIVLVKITKMTRDVVTKNPTKKGNKFFAAEFQQIKTVREGENGVTPDGTLRGVYYTLPRDWPNFDPSMIQIKEKIDTNRTRSLMAEVLTGFAMNKGSDQRYETVDILIKHIEASTKEDGQAILNHGDGIYLLAKTLVAKDSKTGEAKTTKDGDKITNVYFDLVDPSNDYKKVPKKSDD